jgi:lipoprotein NlpI
MNKVLHLVGRWSLARAFFLLLIALPGTSIAAPDQEALEQAKQQMRAGFQAEVDETTRQIASGQVEGKRLASIYRTRGVDQSHLLNYQKAIEDFTRSIEIDGFNPQYYQDRAIAYLRARNFAKADTDLEMALGLDRTNFSALREKGRTAFYLGQHDEAASYFVRAAQQADGDGRIYAALWAAIAAKRAGKPAPLAFNMPEDNARLQWPGPVIKLFSGTMSPEQVLTLSDAVNPRTHLMLQCEAQFYLGQYYLLQGQRDLARSSFKAAVDTGVTDFMEYDWAARELEVLASSGK